MDYNAFRHFADSWGLLYMFAVFVGVIVLLFLPGAKRRASEAANIPLNDDHPLEEERRT
ncbi:MAG: cbb3-type cytochrome c oxidase subunit 3 [Hyphomicrobiaceae bacterium]|nr:cbb3-type cytochrome c oxidase subunit 3 [Hyphomicrobiaceae bacterium]MCC0022755.1 cbb3-type cytochrome c oxidase subunit 3 [Hyphomicrobiaceae bacterium]